MNNTKRPETLRIKRIALFLGDIASFYASFYLTLIVRYGVSWRESLETHLTPFSISLVLWVLIFFVSGLYERKALKNNIYFAKNFFSAVLAVGALMVALFYFVPSFGVAPKTNLFVFIAIAGLCGYFWRRIFNSLIGISSSKTNIILVGDNQSTKELANYIQDNPQLGYKIVLWLRQWLPKTNPDDLRKIIEDHEATLLVVQEKLKRDPAVASVLYHNMLYGTAITSIADFYETIFQMVSVEELGETWPLENLSLDKHSYNTSKRLIEILIATMILIIASPFMLIAALLVRFTSKGPIIYSQRDIVGQKRVGQNGQIFNLYKFRSMYHTPDKNPDAGGDKPTWSSNTDSRVTPIGKILRWTHLDEFPQLFNILNGNMSFIGPRPERPEFDADLKNQIPHYELRYLSRPGITGWAQINYPYGASVEDAYKKLQYDLYYLKHRSVWMDVAIFIRTIKNFFSQS